MTLKQRTAIALISTAAFAVLFCAYSLTRTVRIKVTLQLSSSANSVAQLFYDDGHGYYEAHSRAAIVKSTRPGVFQDVEFTFHVQRLTALRFDPATIPGRFAVRNVRAEANHRLMFTVLPSDVLPLHEISRCDVNAGAATCATQNDAEDPQILLRLPKTFSHLKLAVLAYGPTLVECLAFIIVAMTGLVVLTGDNAKAAIQRLSLPRWMRATSSLGAVCALTGFIFLVLFLRRPDSLLNPQLWAEDAVIFFAQDVRLGFWHALMMPSAGYLHTIPRLIAGVSGILPARFVPLSFSLAALIIEAISCSAFFLPCCRSYIRSDEMRAAVCIVSACVIPAGEEVIGTMANVQWLLIIPGVLIMLWAPERSTSWKVYAAAVTGLLIALTVPLLIVVAPLLAISILRSRKLPPLPAMTTMAGLATQTAVAAQNTTSGHSAAFLDTAKAVIATYVARPVLGALCGERFVRTGSDEKLNIAVAIALAALLAGLVYLVVSSTPAQKLLVAGAVYLTGASLTLALLGRQFVSGLLTPPGWRGFQAERYFVFPTALLIFLVALAVQHVSRGRRMIGFWLLVAIFAYGIEQNFRAPALVDVQWPVYANKVDAWRLARKARAPFQQVDVPINPRPWVLRLD